MTINTAWLNPPFTFSSEGTVDPFLRKRWLYFPLRAKNSKFLPLKQPNSSYALFVSSKLKELFLLTERIKSFSFYKRKGLPLTTMEVCISPQDTFKHTQLVTLGPTFGEYVTRADKAGLLALSILGMPDIRLKISDSGTGFGTNNGLEGDMNAPTSLTFTLTETGISVGAFKEVPIVGHANYYSTLFESRHISHRHYLETIKEFSEHEVPRTASSNKLAD